MLGAIIGDIVGSRFEFNNTHSTRFKLFTPECSFTDDTICTIAIADALLKHQDYARSLRDWCSRYPLPTGGYGGSFSRWITAPDPQPYNSFGNGSAMRVSPVSWAFDTLQDVQRQAIATATPTHNHPDGIIGALCVATCIYIARSLPDPVQGLQTTLRYFYGDSPLENCNPGTFDETCPGTVPLAVHLATEAGSFVAAIRAAVALGGDSDTLAAITGSIAEARFGIPDTIREEALAFLPPEMVDVLQKFNKAFHT